MAAADSRVKIDSGGEHTGCMCWYVSLGIAVAEWRHLFGPQVVFHNMRVGSCAFADLAFLSEAEKIIPNITARSPCRALIAVPGASDR